MFENIAVIPSFRNAVSSAVSSGKLSHALIFEGASEEIRFAVAKETAKAFLEKALTAEFSVFSSVTKEQVEEELKNLP